MPYSLGLSLLLNIYFLQSFPFSIYIHSPLSFLVLHSPLFLSYFCMSPFHPIHRPFLSLFLSFSSLSRCLHIFIFTFFLSHFSLSLSLSLSLSHSFPSSLPMQIRFVSEKSRIHCLSTVN